MYWVGPINRYLYFNRNLFDNLYWIRCLFWQINFMKYFKNLLKTNRFTYRHWNFNWNLYVFNDFNWIWSRYFNWYSYWFFNFIWLWDKYFNGIWTINLYFFLNIERDSSYIWTKKTYCLNNTYRYMDWIRHLLFNLYIFFRRKQK